MASGLTRDVLSTDGLIEEHGEEQSWIDDAGVLAQVMARHYAALRILAELPEGFRIERLRGRIEPGGDPGLELTLIDERFRPQRLVGKVCRRRVGAQRITWTAGNTLAQEPVVAEAFSVALRFAVNDAEGRR